jgi:hypothetical protein
VSRDTTNIDLAVIGVPVPCSWRVEQVEGTVDGVKGFLVKLILVGPTGLHVTFYAGEEAMAMAAAIKRAGNASQLGLWASGLAGEPKGAKGTPDPSAPSTQGSTG